MAAQTPLSLAGRRIWVAGHRGMLGSALVRRLARENCDLLTVERRDLDLTYRGAVERWMTDRRPEIVFVCAALSGGLKETMARAGEFAFVNTVIPANVMDAAQKAGVRKLVAIGASCMYPKAETGAVAESSFLTGPIEPTSAPMGFAKIATVGICQAMRQQHKADFVVAVPPTLYGPGDKFDLDSGHVLSATIRKVLDAKKAGGPVEIWGSGRPERDFLHVDDAADGMVFVATRYSDDAPINIGPGSTISIIDLTRLVADIAGYTGDYRFLTDRPDGALRKTIAAERIAALGWRPSISLRDGIAATMAWYLDQNRMSGPG